MREQRPSRSLVVGIFGVVMVSTLYHRRQALRAIGVTTIAAVIPAKVWAGPLDALELDRRARVLKQGTLVVPPPGALGEPGMAGADITTPGRGFLGIDWAIEDTRELSVMMLTVEQKSQVAKGQRPTGNPLLRVDVQGPETAGQNVEVVRGVYFLAFLNRESTTARLVYRTSFLPF
jgi:hypothetical protein